MQYEIQFIKHAYAGAVVEQRAMDGYINATAMCKVAGKLFADYGRLLSTQEFLEALSADMGIPISQLVQSVKCGFAQGTWVHPQVAIHLAQWLSPTFAVQVTKWVYDWISGAAAPQQRVTPAFVQRYHANSARVEAGHFSVINELFVRFYGKLEAVGYILKDRGLGGREIRPDVSVGRTFSDWLSANRPEKAADFKFYWHQLPDNNIVEARQYRNRVLPDFIEFVEEVWIPQRANAYLSERDPEAIPYLQLLLPAPAKKKRIR